MSRVQDTPSEEMQDGTASEPDFRILVLRGVARSFVWVCVLVALGAAVGIVVGLIQPNAFVSEAKLILRVGAREQITSESLLGMDDVRNSSPPTMVDEIQMLSDTAVFERVARDLGPRSILEAADPERNDSPLTALPFRWLHRLQSRYLRWIAPIQDCPDGQCPACLRKATKVLIESTTVSIEPGSNVIRVIHASTSPEKARVVVQALVNAFIERHRDQFSIQPLVEKNRGKVEASKKARDVAVAAYTDHLNTCGLVDLETQGPAMLAEINLLSSEMFAARVRREEISRQKVALSARLQGIPPEIELLEAAVSIPNEEYETQLALKREMLARRRTLDFETLPIEEARRREKEFDELIAKVTQELERTPRTIVQTPEKRGKTANPEYVALKTRIDDLSVEDQGLAAKESLLNGRLTEKQDRIEQLRTCEVIHKELGSARDAEESRYKYLLERFSALEALANLDLHEEANLRVLQLPTLDRDKVGPGRFALLVKGILAGLLAGVAFAVLRQQFDNKLRHAETVERAFGMPMLGIVPELASLRRLSKKKKKLASARPAA